MNGIFLLVEILIGILLISQEWMLLLIWFTLFMMLQMSYYYGNEVIYLEVIEDYPIEDCIKPKRCKFIFKKLARLSYKDIPKELYYREVTRVIGFGIYSVVFIFLLLLSACTDLIILIAKIYICWEVFVIFSSSFILLKKAFLSRFRRLSRHNLKYIFLTGNEPYPKKIGTCKIIGERKRWKSKFVTVYVIETGEIKEKVLLQGNKRIGEKPIYSLYEICKVYYIV